jgi:hypothetical protein
MTDEEIAALPRVTHILDEVGLGPDFTNVKPADLEYAGIRGKAVHAAIESIFYEYFDEKLYSPDVLARVDAYRKFVRESGYKTLKSEIQVVSPTWRYRGHLDSVGWIGSKRVIPDWKNTESVQLRPAGRQLAGYRVAWNEQNPTEPVDVLMVVQLKGDGTYRVHEVSAAEYEPIFFAAVMVYHERRSA